MLYNLTFRTKDLTLPLGYQLKLQGLVYHLMKFNPELSTFIHDEGYQSFSGNRFKLFSFSQLRGRCFVKNGRIIFPEQVSFSLRTADPAFAEILNHSLHPGLVCTLDGQKILLESAQLEELHLECNQIKIRAVSPITVYTTTPDRKTIYYNPLDEEFSRRVNENYHRKWESAFGEAAPDDVKLYALSVGHKDKCVTKIKGIYVTVWGGTYLLKGEPRALEFLYHTGIGAKNSMGFGQFDIVRLPEQR